MTARIELAGLRFGRWAVLQYIGRQRWLCRCDCGSEKSVDGSSLRHRQTSGCIKCHPALGKNRTHGQKRTRLYSIWSGMKARCSNPNEAAFARYGARGISVCVDWSLSFEAFRDWALSNGYQAHLTIERVNNDGNYEPDNCTWITLAAQKMNRRNTVWVEWGGRRLTLIDLAAETGLTYDLLKQRLRRGWTVEKAVSFEVQRGNIDTPHPTPPHPTPPPRQSSRPALPHEGMTSL